MLGIIAQRKSTRTFQKRALSKEDIKLTKTILDHVKSEERPFKQDVDFFFQENKTHQQGKIGTYGFIKHPPAFIGGVVENTLKGMVDYGFLFEQVILALTLSNLGTVWLGGTFHRNQFHIPVEEQKIIPAISPVGYSASKSLREKIIRKVSNADNRKPLSELFFLGESLEAVPQAHPYLQYLKAVRLAPSASNKQPWRIVLDNDTFYLFLDRTKSYGNSLAIDIQAIDIGIALSYLYVSLIGDDKLISFVYTCPLDIDEWEYIIGLKII
ncbi:MAG: nitroreductase family protein [Candidatus Izemoplasma sp.]|nr:nitroreductase family protein [Candidatus Izemoplasma sp.]